MSCQAHKRNRVRNGDYTGFRCFVGEFLIGVWYLPRLDVEPHIVAASASPAEPAAVTPRKRAEAAGSRGKMNIGSDPTAPAEG